jgi:hypothetical protein
MVSEAHTGLSPLHFAASCAAARLRQSCFPAAVVFPELSRFIKVVTPEVPYPRSAASPGAMPQPLQCSAASVSEGLWGL